MKKMKLNMNLKEGWFRSGNDLESLAKMAREMDESLDMIKVNSSELSVLTHLDVKSHTGYITKILDKKSLEEFEKTGRIDLETFIPLDSPKIPYDLLEENLRDPGFLLFSQEHGILFAAPKVVNSIIQKGRMKVPFVGRRSMRLRRDLILETILLEEGFKAEGRKNMTLLCRQQKGNRKVFFCGGEDTLIPTPLGRSVDAINRFMRKHGNCDILWSTTHYITEIYVRKKTEDVIEPGFRLITSSVGGSSFKVMGGYWAGTGIMPLIASEVSAKHDREFTVEDIEGMIEKAMEKAESFGKEMALLDQIGQKPEPDTAAGVFDSLFAPNLSEAKKKEIKPRVEEETEGLDDLRQLAEIILMVILSYEDYSEQQEEAISRACAQLPGKLLAMGELREVI